MSAGPLPAVFPAVGVTVVPRWEPYLVEVLIPIPLGVQDQIIEEARQAVEALLAGPQFTGEPTSTTPPQDDDSPRIATTAFVQAELRQALAAVTALAQQAAASARAAQAAAPEAAQAAITQLLTTPGALREVLPKTQPSTPDTLWVNGDTPAFTPSA